MKLREPLEDKVKVDYFGKMISFPTDYKHITTDRCGDIYVWKVQPYPNMSDEDWLAEKHQSNYENYLYVDSFNVDDDGVEDWDESLVSFVFGRFRVMS